MKRHRRAPKGKRRHTHARDAASEAAPPQTDASYPGAIDTQLEDLLIDPDDFDDDAVALVTDVQRTHFNHEGLLG